MAKAKKSGTAVSPKRKSGNKPVVGSSSSHKGPGLPKGKNPY